MTDSGGFSESEKTQRKEAVLERSPFTRNLINIRKVRTRHELDEWSLKYKETGTSLHNEIAEKFGKNWREVIVEPLFISSVLHNAVDQNQGRGVIWPTVADIFVMGYEVGEDVDVVFEDVFETIDKLKVLNRDSDRSQDASLAVMNILQVGKYFKSKTSKQSFSQGESDVPEVFREFIKGLDLEGI